MRSRAWFAAAKYFDRAVRTSRRNIALIVFLTIVLAFFAAFLVYPLFYVFREAFWVEGALSLERFHYIVVEAGEYIRGAAQEIGAGKFLSGLRELQQVQLFNSLMLAVMTTIVTSLVALPMALLGARRRFRGKGLLTALALAPMIMPPFVGAIGIRNLLGRDGGLNALLQGLGISGEIDFLGSGQLWPLVCLQALHLYPILYLNVTAALANIDPSLEEAGRNLGDAGLRLFRKITFPLMLPGYFAGATLVFIWSFTDLGTPLIFKVQSRFVSGEIFNKLNEVNSNPYVYAYVVTVILLSAGLFMAGRAFVSRRGYEMLAKGTVARQEKPLSPFGTVGAWLFMGGLTAMALLPHLTVLLTSVAGRWNDTVLPTRWTLKFYREALREPWVIYGVRNSLMLSLGCTALAAALGVGIAYVVTRKRFRGSGLLDALSMMPLAVPGLVLAFGYMVCFANTGTWLDPKRSPYLILIIAYAVRRLPYMTRAAVAGFQQVSPAFEEAARNVGAHPLRALWRITLPLIAANLIAGAILTFTFAMLEVSDSLILASSKETGPLAYAIYNLSALPGDGESIACALGVFAMALLGATLMVASRLLGKRMGQLFRIG